MKNLSFLSSLGLLALGMTAASDGATISIGDAVSSASNVTYDISSYGALDWAVWQKAAGTNAAYNVATNSKNGATAVSDLFLVGTGSGFRASTTSTPNWDFTFTDGTSPTAGTISDANGVFHPTIGSSGKGVGLTVTLPTTSTYRITLFVAGYSTTSNLAVSLAGATTLNNTSFTPVVSNPKSMAYFTIDATADTAGDVLRLEFTNTSATSSDSHVMISAVAVQMIPEPSSAMLALGTLAGGLLVRRRIRP